MRGRVGMLAMIVSACGSEPASATPAVHEPARSAVEPAAPPEPGYASPTPSGDVLGHVRIADPFALVAKVSDRLAPRDRASALTIDELRNAARAAAKSRPAEALAIHLDPSRPLACALLDPTRHSLPFACVLGFTGGLAQLLDDLGPHGRTASGPDAAHYEIDGWSIHLHALGPDVVVAFDDAAFVDSRDYLSALTRSGGEWDVEITVHAASAIDRLREPLRDLTRDLVGAVTNVRDDPLMMAIVGASARELAVLAPLFADEGEDVLGELIDVAAQVGHTQLAARMDDDGLTLSLRAAPKPASALHTALREAPALPTALLDWVPRHTWLVWIERVVTDSLLVKSEAFVRHAAAGLLADALGHAPPDVDAVLQQLSAENATLYDDARVVALFNGPGTWGGAVLVRPLRGAQSGREQWLTWSRGIDPTALFGSSIVRELDKIVQYDLTENALTIEGVPVDRFALRPAPRFAKRLGASLSREDAFARELLQWAAEKPALLAIDRFEDAGAAAFVVAPGAAPEYAERVLAARRGTDRAAHEQLDRWLARHEKPRFVLALSIADAIAFLHTALPPELRESIPAKAGRELGDIALATWIDAADDPTWIAELHATQPVIDLVRDRWH